MSFSEELSKDLSNVFFRTGEGQEFAEEGLYTPTGGPAFAVRLIADATYNEAQPQVGTHAIRVQTTYRRVLLPVQCLPPGVTIKKGDKVSYSSGEFQVVTKELDEAGEIYQISLHRRANAPS